MKIVAAYNIKGGVGKTSAAVNVAALAAGSGLRTVLWDLDPQGAATFLFRIKPKVRGGGERLVRGKSAVSGLLRGTDLDGLDLLPADFSYRHMDLALAEGKRQTRQLRRALQPLEDEYDLAVLDCAPSISLVSENVFEAADALLVPIIPTTLSVRTFEQLLRFLAADVERPPEVLAFFSMVDRRKRAHRDIVAMMPEQFSSMLEATIPSSTWVERMGVERAPLALFAPRSVGARAYTALWSEMRVRLRL